MPLAGPWNEQIASLLSHRSVRAYEPEPVPEGTLETLIAAAQSTATSSNMQTWSVIVVRDPATRAELARIAGNQHHIEQCPLYLVWLADLSRNQRLGDAEDAGMPVMPYLETFLVAVIDAALAAQNAVVAAESLGLSTVYIGAMRNQPARVAELLGLPNGVFAVFGLCVGHAAAGSATEVKPRLPQAVVVHEEMYDNARERALRASYDKEIAAFTRRNEMAEETWTRKVLVRMGQLAGMNGRETLSDVLRGLGFPLR